MEVWAGGPAAVADEAWVTFEWLGDGAFLSSADAAASPSFDAKPGDFLDFKQFQDLQDRILRVAQEDATVSDHPG